MEEKGQCQGGEAAGKGIKKGKPWKRYSSKNEVTKKNKRQNKRTRFEP